MVHLIILGWVIGFIFGLGIGSKIQQELSRKKDDK